MKSKLLIIALVFLFIGCKSDAHTIYVWNMKDVIGLSFLGIIIVVISILFLAAWIQDKINSWKRKN